MSKYNTTSVHEINKHQYNSPIIFAGFVGPGLVGTLTVHHMIKNLKMKEVAFMKSPNMPPVTVFMQGRLRHPFRFYTNEEGNICAIICEITLPKEGLFSMTEAILNWAEEKNSNEIIILDGVTSDKEHDKQTFCAAESDMCRIMEDKNISMIPQGFITGVTGSLLNECLMRPIRGVTLLVKVKDKTDPLAAATLIRSINKVYGTNIDTEELEKENARLGKEYKEMSEEYQKDRSANSGMYM